MKLQYPAYIECKKLRTERNLLKNSLNEIQSQAANAALILAQTYARVVLALNFANMYIWLGFHS